MITVLLTILKIIGIILLCVLLTLFCVLLLVLFVPVRYRIETVRREGEETPFRVLLKVTWLLHILNAAFRYPGEDGLRVRVFGFTVFPARRKEKAKEKETEKEEEPRDDETEKAANPQDGETKKAQEMADGQEEGKPAGGGEVTGSQEREKEAQTESPKGEAGQEAEEEEETEEGEPNWIRKLRAFVHRHLERLKNIKYTIQKICDKIKEITKNIRYYVEIIQSDAFLRVWRVCGGEALKLLRGVLPGKIKGRLLVGTGDPASTAQIIGIHGILYPLIGDHIMVIPDFERTIVEGELLIKGKLTVFRALKTAIIIYFNKDLRKVIRLLKKEAA